METDVDSRSLFWTHAGRTTRHTDNYVMNTFIFSQQTCVWVRLRRGYNFWGEELRRHMLKNKACVEVTLTDKVSWTPPYLTAVCMIRVRAVSHKAQLQPIEAEYQTNAAVLISCWFYWSMWRRSYCLSKSPAILNMNVSVWFEVTWSSSVQICCTSLWVMVVTMCSCHFSLVRALGKQVYFPRAFWSNLILMSNDRVCG